MKKDLIMLPVGILLGLSPFAFTADSFRELSSYCYLLTLPLIPMSMNVFYITTPAITEVVHQYALPLIAVGIAGGAAVGIGWWIFLEVKSRLASMQMRRNAQPVNPDAA